MQECEKKKNKQTNKTNKIKKLKKHLLKALLFKSPAFYLKIGCVAVTRPDTEILVYLPVYT